METGGGVSPREQLLKQLAAGHDTYMELVGNLKEGSKVWNGGGEGRWGVVDHVLYGCGEGRWGMVEHVWGGEVGCGGPCAV